MNLLQTRFALGLKLFVISNERELFRGRHTVLLERVHCLPNSVSEP